MTGKNTTPYRRAQLFLLLILLTAWVLWVHGYHPLADDGAVYVAGIKKLAVPSLYPVDAVFALSPTRLSMFAHVLAAFISLTHLPLDVLLLLCHLASIFLFLLACLKLAEGLFSTRRAQWGALLMAACCFTLPVAGTSLTIMDPYVTARSFSTPLSLLALAALLGDQYLAAASWLTLAALLHPLMAAYAAIVAASVALARRHMWGPLSAFCALGWLVGGGIFALSRNADLNSAWSLAVLSRSYFFLSSWQWYEYLGLGIPLLLLAVAAIRVPLPGPARDLVIAVIAVAGCALLTSVCFVHRGGSLWLARLQVLRSFQWVYLIGVLLAGGLLGMLAQRHQRLVAAIYGCIALALFAGQRLTYPASLHVEWPGRPPVNKYQQAFLWIRTHTPPDAVFALDNDYVEAAGEDAQGFRATAERSAVADYFKDGGIASNFPQAAELWRQGSLATANLNQATDAERIARLQPLGVTWIVLPSQAGTSLVCPFENQGVRVCRLGILFRGTNGAK